ISFLIYFIATPHPVLYSLSLHDALPILFGGQPSAEPLLGAFPRGKRAREPAPACGREAPAHLATVPSRGGADPASALERGQRARSEETRLNSSHVAISYAVFCLKKKNKS